MSIHEHPMSIHEHHTGTGSTARPHDRTLKYHEFSRLAETQGWNGPGIRNRLRAANHDSQYFEDMGYFEIA